MNRSLLSGVLALMILLAGCTISFGDGNSTETVTSTPVSTESTTTTETSQSPSTASSTTEISASSTSTVTETTSQMATDGSTTDSETTKAKTLGGTSSPSETSEETVQEVSTSTATETPTSTSTVNPSKTVTETAATPEGNNTTTTETPEDTEADANEPDDDTDNATAVDRGETVEATLTKGDQDFYVVDLGVNETITAEASGDVDAEVSTYFPDVQSYEKPVAGEDGVLGTAPFPVEAGDVVYNSTLDPGESFVSVQLQDDAEDTSGSYTLTILNDSEDAGDSETSTDNGTVDFVPADEPNNEPANATALPTGIDASDSVGPNDTEDWFAVDLDAGDEVTVRGIDFASDTTLTAFGPASDDVENVDVSDLDELGSGGFTVVEETLVEFTAEEDGTYYFRVSDDPNDGDEPVDGYDFSVNVDDSSDSSNAETASDDGE